MMLEAVCIIDLVVIPYMILPTSAPALALHCLDAQAKKTKVTLTRQ